MKRNRHGFTILELLVVVGIMVLIMSIAGAGYIGIRRGAEIRGAVMTLRTALMLARQSAVTQRKTVTVEFKNGATLALPDRINVFSTSLGNITTNSVIMLPLGIQYDSGVEPPSIVFKPSGRAMGIGWQAIKLTEKQGAVAGTGTSRGSRTVKVWFLTGVTIEVP